MFDNPSYLPDNWQPKNYTTPYKKVRAIADYIASRTEYDLSTTLKKFGLLTDIT